MTDDTVIVCILGLGIVGAAVLAIGWLFHLVGMLQSAVITQAREIEKLRDQREHHKVLINVKADGYTVEQPDAHQPRLN